MNLHGPVLLYDPFIHYEHMNIVMKKDRKNRTLSTCKTTSLLQEIELVIRDSDILTWAIII